MERDFLGLSLKEPLAEVKEEVSSDGCKEIGFNKASGIHWPFSNKVSALPHLMSFKVAQEEKTKKIVDRFDPSKKRSLAESQKLFNHNGQVGTHFSLTSCPLQHDVHSVHHPHDMKMFPVSNHAISNPTSSSLFKNHYATAGSNMAGSTLNLKPQLLGGIPISAPHSILPSIGSVTGITESCSKASGSPGQLTIFYTGTVSVYDDILPEKAQAIMLFAGNGSSIPSNTTQPKIQVQAPSSKPMSNDAGPVTQPMITPPCSRLSSPLSVSSQTGAQSGSGSTSTEEIMAAKTTGIATTPVSKQEPPKIASAMGSVSATMIPSVPQARKASLARFLEKRKERVMNAGPYNHSKKAPELSESSME